MKAFSHGYFGRHPVRIPGRIGESVDEHLGPYLYDVRIWRCAHRNGSRRDSYPLAEPSACCASDSSDGTLDQILGFLNAVHLPSETDDDGTLSISGILICNSALREELCFGNLQGRAIRSGERDSRSRTDIPCSGPVIGSVTTHYTISLPECYIKRSVGTGEVFACNQ